MDLRILERFSTDFYILSRTQDTHVRYAPLYITSFPLNASRKQLEAQQFQNQWGSYEVIDNIPDRLHWLRHSRGLMQKEVAKIAGVSRGVYINLETGEAKQMPVHVADRLAQFYGVPVEELLDDYSRFLLNDQAAQLLKYHTEAGMTREALAQQRGRTCMICKCGKRAGAPSAIKAGNDALQGRNRTRQQTLVCSFFVVVQKWHQWGNVVHRVRLFLRC